MDTNGMPAKMVGNEFLVPAPRLQAAAPAAPEVSIPVRSPVLGDTVALDYELETIPAAATKPWQRFSQPALDFIHKYSLGTFALLFLAVGLSATPLATNYLTNRIEASAPNIEVKRSGQPARGYNMSLPIAESDTKLSQITSQSITITLGARTETFSASTIKGWVSTVNDNNRQISYLHVHEDKILASLKALAAKQNKAPKNQVSITRDGVSRVIAGGTNGLQVGDPAAAAKNIAQNLFAAKGMKEDIPVKELPFAAVTPAAFKKMIEVDLTTKQMYLYENGTLFKQYAISAGAPSTPTPVGQFKTEWKLPKQDMRGYNPDGSKYFQPNVKWISYFAPGGVAIHGNYWRPASWFGVRNSSHGCVSLPDYQAKEVYNWTPTGTTVITHL